MSEVRIGKWHGPARRLTHPRAAETVTPRAELAAMLSGLAALLREGDEQTCQAIESSALGAVCRSVRSKVGR